MVYLNKLLDGSFGELKTEMTFLQNTIEPILQRTKKVQGYNDKIDQLAKEVFLQLFSKLSDILTQVSPYFKLP
jgi:oligoendopeptidase F